MTNIQDRTEPQGETESVADVIATMREDAKDLASKTGKSTDEQMRGLLMSVLVGSYATRVERALTTQENPDD